ncbi:PREDICTED: pre-rRNA-processing protein TSR2 homolog isoform X2 [Nelumbo nucifera]|uniref:Pre-rRNA-processing protein TSR2 homolog isoform X2 n=1 Tax=Nelumbo nucifera TaxID=4432 RepID=A0A1U8AAH0_NELNU|nr:PREDICTED: pre-rRNA-processing protein TSR2 homolog isoform X2 [Nelumbo nucifera]
MGLDNGGHVPAQPSPESLSRLSEGISLLLSRWTALQMAIENEWGGKDSRQKSEQLAADIFSWFSQSREPHYIDDLENMLDENMVLSFNTDIEDGSIEKVAEQLIVMHEDCQQGNYESIEKLRKSNFGKVALSQNRQIPNGIPIK